MDRPPPLPLGLARFTVEWPARQGSPLDRPADFLHAEEMISWLLLRDEHFRARLLRAGTREEIVGLLAEADRDSLWETAREASRQVRARQRQDPPPA